MYTFRLVGFIFVLAAKPAVYRTAHSRIFTPTLKIYVAPAQNMTVLRQGCLPLPLLLTRGMRGNIIIREPRGRAVKIMGKGPAARAPRDSGNIGFDCDI